MRWVLNRSIIFTAVITFACYVLPVNTIARGGYAAGKATAEDAAKLNVEGDTDGATDKPLRFALSDSHAWSQPDSSVFEFPEEENQHLVRDITIFVVASVLVGYFIVKVFLEGDKDEEEQTDGGGKDIPF